MNSQFPVLSVCLITYNHVKYIQQAIEGVLMQKVDFKWELIIADDYSTDGTREIVKAYKEKYPDFITLILQEKNVGAAKNWLDLLMYPHSKYIAYFEGDDYWFDPCKLQKQVDFLEENEDFSICFHAVKIKNEQDNILVDDNITREVPDVTDIYELAKGNYIHTPSVVFRRNEEVFKQFFALGELPVGDYVLHILNAQHGKIKKLPEKMAVYRAGVGAWSATDFRYRLPRWLSVLDKLIQLFAEDEKISYLLKQQYGEYVFQLYDIYERDNDFDTAKLYFMKLCENFPDILYKECKRRNSEMQALRKSKANRMAKLVLKPLQLLRRWKT